MAETSISGIEFNIVGATGKAKRSVDRLTASLKGLRSALATSSTKKLKNDLDDVEKSTKKSETAFGKLFKSVGRITFYRAIRMALKYISAGFKEGLENAYQFSKVTGYELAGTMDRLASSSLKMKNQLGSAFGGLLMAIEPPLLQIIALVTRAANALAQFMAVIGGKSTYLKAVDTVTEYGEAVGGAGAAAKEAMRYLAPFDELNVIPGDNGSGGGGGGASTPDYSSMFEETPVSQSLKDFATDFKLSVSDVLFDWSNLTGEQIAEKALSGLFGLTGAGIGFIIGGLPGAVVGTVVGVALSLLADTFIFDHDGVLESSEIAHGLQYVLNALAGGVIGFSIGGPGGALIGVGAGLGISLLANAAEMLPGSEKINGDVLLDQLTTALGMLTGGIIGFHVGGPAGALIGATIGLGITAVITALKFNKSEGTLSGESGRTGLDYFVVDVLGLPSNEQWEEWGENIWKKVSEGVKKGWHWLTEGVEDIKEELYNIFIKPIVDAFDEFAEKHPKVAKLLGIENGSSDVLAPGAAAAESMWGGTLELDAEVTDVKDSIPREKKTIKDFLADLFGTKDSIPVEKKVSENWGIHVTEFEDKITPSKKSTTSYTAQITNVDQSKLTAEQKTVPTTAKLNSVTNGLTGNSKPTIPVTANLNSSKNSLTGKSLPTVAVKASFESSTNKLTGKHLPKIDARANLTTYQRNFKSDTVGNKGKQPIIASVAAFTSRRTGDLDKTINTKANFTEHTIGYTPTINTDAKITRTYVDPVLGKPTIDVNARITGQLGNYTMAKGGSYYGGKWHGIPQAAAGGKFHGTLFWAGENGAEVVGHAGGRTEVLNRSQLASTMYAAVTRAMSGVQFSISDMRVPGDAGGGEGTSEDMIYRAMLRALNDSDAFPDEIDLDGDVVYRKMVARNQMNTRMTGRNAMAATA